MDLDTGQDLQRLRLGQPPSRRRAPVAQPRWPRRRRRPRKNSAPTTSLEIYGSGYKARSVTSPMGQTAIPAASSRSSASPAKMSRTRSSPITRLRLAAPRPVLHRIPSRKLFCFRSFQRLQEARQRVYENRAFQKQGTRRPFLSVFCGNVVYSERLRRLLQLCSASAGFRRIDGWERNFSTTVMRDFKV
ncbi:hypothetical protein ACFX13_036672 [Malus domestica]